MLPFENLSDHKDDYLADGITDDLTGDLAIIYDAFVIARETAYTYKGKLVDVRKIGAELGVRYVLEGSVRRIGDTLREQIVTRMRSELRFSLVEVEKSRSLRERPTNPDAFDLVLRARSLSYQLPSLQRNAEAQALYERALELDPSSVPAMVGVAFYLVDRRGATGSWGRLENKQRAETLLTQARAIAPDSSELLMVTSYWLRIMRRCGESVATAEELVRRFPNLSVGYSQLAQCKTLMGHAEEAIPVMQRAIRISPRSPYLFNCYRLMGEASVMLGKDQDAITFFEK